MLSDHAGNPVQNARPWLSVYQQTDTVGHG
jgi:hypothetical protein